jgi:hypothetical protein
MALMGYSGARGTLIYEKNLMSKISCQTPFKGSTNGVCDIKIKQSLQCKQRRVKHRICNTDVYYISINCTVEQWAQLIYR